MHTYSWFIAPLIGKLQHKSTDLTKTPNRIKRKNRKKKPS